MPSIFICSEKIYIAFSIYSLYQNLKFRAFWDIASRSLGVDRRFRSAYWLTMRLIALMMKAVRTSET
jgi:hypothetical protein